MTVVAAAARVRLSVPSPFELPLVARSHGWVSLPPNRWASEDGGAWRTVLGSPDGPVDVTVRSASRGLEARLHAAGRPSAAVLAGVRRHLRHMLRLDEDLRPFWSLCRQHPQLEWAARRGAGRLLRGPTPFEDLLKLLLTTNCSWAATRGMVRRLVDALGERAPSGERAFPTAEACAGRDERFWRETVRAGYRASACRGLARLATSGALDERALLDPDTPTDTVRQRLLALPGFGPYAAGQALRLLGRYDDLALDSWCRARLATVLGARAARTEGGLRRRYAAFGRWRGLALWLHLTASWHGEGAEGR